MAAASTPNTAPEFSSLSLLPSPKEPGLAYGPPAVSFTCSAAASAFTRVFTRSAAGPASAFFSRRRSDLIHRPVRLGRTQHSGIRRDRVRRASVPAPLAQVEGTPGGDAVHRNVLIG